MTTATLTKGTIACRTTPRVRQGAGDYFANVTRLRQEFSGQQPVELVTSRVAAGVVLIKEAGALADRY